MNLKQPRIKSILIPVLLGIAAVTAQIIAGQVSDQLMIAAALGIPAAVSLALLFTQKRYDSCGWFTLAVCAGLLAVILFIVLKNPEIRVGEFSVYLMFANWAAAVIPCLIVRLADRRGHFGCFDRFFRVSSMAFAGVYLFTLIYALFIKSHFTGINLIPFKTIIPYLTGSVVANANVMVINLLANILLFLPLGFYLHIIQIKPVLRLGLLLAAPVTIEILQYLTHRGIMDIDDVLLNFVGGLLGMVLHIVLEKTYRRIRRDGSARMLRLS